MNADQIQAQAVDLLVEIYALLQQAYGPDLRGARRGALASNYYLARIRDRLLGYRPEKPAQVCESCIELRRRLTNIYHLTLTAQDAPGALLSVRAASGPGAPAASVGCQACGWPREFCCCERTLDEAEG